MQEKKEKMRNDNKIKYITKAGLIAAIYCVLTLVLAPWGYGAIQCRIAEAMTILPFLMPEAIPGLLVGCFFANIFGGYGPVDIVFGSLTTLLAAYITSKMPNKYLATLPPVILNGLIISIWVSGYSLKVYPITALTMGLGEFGAASIGGLILYESLMKYGRKQNNA